MTPVWAICIKPDGVDSLGPLRCMRGLQVCMEDEEIWVRGENLETLSSLEVRSLPAVGRYQIDTDRLLPLGKRLPVGLLPKGPWSPLQEWAEVDMARPLLPGKTLDRLALSLTPSESPAESNLLITSVEACRVWAEHASALRLARLSIASDLSQQRVLVKGTPLPPLPGARYVINDSVGLPTGYDFDLSISRVDVVSLLRLSPGQCALFEPDGSWSVFNDDDLTAATRSTLRLLGRSGPSLSGEQVVS